MKARPSRKQPGFRDMTGGAVGDADGGAAVGTLPPIPGIIIPSH